MKGIVCIVVSCYMGYVLSELEPKQVNLQLDTILQFNKKDQRKNLKLLDEVQNFLHKIKTFVKGRGGTRRSGTVLSFADFIIEAATIIKELNDADLEDTFAIIDDETRRYIYKETYLQELFGDQDFRRYVADKLDVVKDMPAETLRLRLDNVIDIIKEKKRTGDDVLDFANNLYAGAGDYLREALINLENIRKSNTADLENVLKDTLRSLVLDHYFKLKNNVKQELVNMIKHYWRAFSNQKPGKRTTLRQTLNDSKEKSFLLDLNYPDEKEPLIDLTRTKQKQKLLTDYEFMKSSEERGIKEIEVTHGPISEITESFESKHKKKKHHRKHKSHHKSDLKFGFTKGMESDDKIEFRGIKDAVPKKVRTTKKNSRGKLSKKHPERTHEKQKSHEIVFAFNKIFDIEFRRRTPGLFNISVQRRKENEISKHDVDGRKWYNDISAVKSGEDMSIDKMNNNNDANTGMRLMRKSNVNDTLESETLEFDKKSKTHPDVQKIIENIEKRIEEVEERVQYVKSLQFADDRISEPKFKSVDSEEHLAIDSKPYTDKTLNISSLEKDNEEFLLNDTENVTSGNISIRAHDDKLNTTTTITTTVDNNIKQNDGNNTYEENQNKLNYTNEGEFDAKKLNGNEYNNTAANSVNDSKTEDYKNLVTPFLLNATDENMMEKLNYGEFIV